MRRLVHGVAESTELFLAVEGPIFLHRKGFPFKKFFWTPLSFYMSLQLEGYGEAGKVGEDFGFGPTDPFFYVATF